MAWRDWAWRGKAVKARHDGTWRDGAGRDVAVKVRPDGTGLGRARLGSQGKVMARLGMAGQGEA